MKRSTLFLVVALAVGSGLAGYMTGKYEDGRLAPPPPAVAQAPVAPAPQTTPAPTPATAPGVAPPAATARPTPPAATEGFAYRRLALDSSRPEGEACLVFNRPLAPADGSVRYADYVAITPEVRAAVRPVDDKLCVGGLAYGSTYTVQLRAGLAAADGSKLEEERSVEIALGARPPVVSLPGKGFILPRGSSAGLPVTTVNVSKVGVAVYRVNERGLERFTRDRYDITFPGNSQTDGYTLRSWLTGDYGAEQWRGTMEVRNVQNQPVTTAFPIRETIGADWKPGAYFVVVWNAAKPPAIDDYDSDAWSEAAGLWVVDTDIALTSFSGADGVTVFARSLDSAKALQGVEIVLLSRGNEPLGRATSDAQGRVNFPVGLTRGRGAAEPVAAMAFDAAKQEFSRLELGKAAFDLSDRGIEGRDPPGPVDAFLYTERGVYRPGETVHLVALLRDQGGVALKDLPVTLIVRRPDGTEFQKTAVALQAGGSVTQAVALPKSSRRGRWTIAAYIDPKAPAVGRVEFAVEDFVPEKLKVELTSPEPILRPGTPSTLSVVAEFLYGAPGSGLQTEADMRVTVDPAPFPAFPRYAFGPEKSREAFEPPMIVIKPPDTDAAGRAPLEWDGSGIPDTAMPLRAQITARVFEPGGGRATKTEKILPMRSRAAYIGVRPEFDGRYAREGTDVAFDLVAVDAAGRQIDKPGVTWTIERITNSYQWYQVDGRWRWQSIANERIVAADTLDLKADRPVRLGKRLSWGRHRLTVSDAASGTTTSLTFNVGYYGGGADSEDAPDALKVASDKPHYAPGETAKLRIEAPFAGEALVAVATDRIQEIHTVAVAPGGTVVEIPMKADWGAGAYALVTAWRPLAAPAERTPVRAIGAVWLGLDPKLRTLAVEIAAPEKMVPRQKVEVVVRVANFVPAAVPLPSPPPAGEGA